MTIMVKVDMCYPETTATGPYKPVYEPVTRIVIGIFQIKHTSQKLWIMKLWSKDQWFQASTGQSES